ncbi:MAG: leucine-rich repeat protein [Paludibacteraceae bacterium]|nr:leucine-rich repeat protein [Paludibacteraceae bacterium]
MVFSIVFTVTFGSTSSDPVDQEPVTWDFANDAELASISLTQYTHYNFGGYYSEYYDNHYSETVKDFKGIVATISAMIEDSYASFSDNNNNSIDLEAGGTLTFSTALGQFESIVVNTNGGSGRSSGDWTWNLTEKTLTWAGTPANSVVLDNVYVSNITSIVFTFVSAASADPEPEPIPGPSFTWEQRQVNHVDLIGDYGGEPSTAPVIKNIITSIARTSNGGNCYFGHWENKGKLNIGNCGYLTFKSIVGDLRAIVITCSTVTTAEDLSTDWTYDGEAGTLTWKGTTASDEVTLSGYLNIDIAEIEFYYTPASAPRLGQSFYDAAYQLYEITGAKTAKVAQQQWLSHTLDIPASVENGGVTYYITEIDDYAFQNDLDLPNVMGGANIGRVGAHAFDGCHRMDEIDIESEVLDEIGEAAFRGCKLMQDIGFYTELPPVLGANAFDDTRYLNHILVPYGNLEAYQAASGWSTYAAKINTTYSDPQVGEQFFYHNQTTTNIYAVLTTSPKEAKVLPYTAEVNAIYPITRTGTLVIPEEALYIHNMYTITGIGANAYKDSTRFTTVMMPIAVKLIEEGAFRNCTGVEKVYFLWDDPATVTWADADQGLDFRTAASGETKIFVPENRLAEYKAWAPAWASCMIGADILDVTATGDPHNNLRHYRTFYDSQADYLLPPSVWAHAGYVSGSDFILTPVAFDGEILPRGTAVVLESETPTYRLIPVGNDAPAYTGRNDLRGTDVAIPRTSVGNNGENVYVLGNQATIGGNLQVGMGMYRYTGTTLGAHKAYLIYDGAGSGSSNQQNAPVRFLFNRDEQATGFENVQEGNASCTKILRDGQLIIIKDNKEYNAQGLIIK